MTRSLKRMGGFSLVEMMVALVAGMIVLGAVLAFTVSSVRANSGYVQSTRLMQELRNISGFITSELKRAGYDENAMKYVGNPTSTEVSVFAPMLIDETAGENCIIYAYDRQPGTPGVIDLDNAEIRGIRRKTATVDGTTVGVIEVAESAVGVTPACDGNQPDYSQYPVACNAGSGWCPLSDPKVIDITDPVGGEAFNVETAGTADESNGVRTTILGSNFNALQQRELQITLIGALRNDMSAARTVRANVKVRADCLRPLVTTSCDVAPAP
jgi:type II secretory pathway component PulJ